MSMGMMGMPAPAMAPPPAMLPPMPQQPAGRQVAQPQAPPQAGPFRQFVGGMAGMDQPPASNMAALGLLLKNSSFGYQNSKGGGMMIGGGQDDQSGDYKEFAKMLEKMMGSQNDGSEGVSSPTQSPTVISNDKGTFTPGGGEDHGGFEMSPMFRSGLGQQAGRPVMQGIPGMAQMGGGFGMGPNSGASRY